MRNLIHSRVLRLVLSFVLVLSAVGCNGSARKEWDRKALAVGAVSDAVKFAVESKHVTDPDALNAMKFGLLTAKNALQKSYPLAMAGEKEDAAFWYGQLDDALAQAAAQYSAPPKPNGATSHGTPSIDSGRP
jgi:hypothetical protein